MSHYTVAVISRTGTEEEVAELLSPFDENIEVEPYIHRTKEQITKEGASIMKKLLKKYKSLKKISLLIFLLVLDTIGFGAF